MPEHTATVEALTAEVRVLMVGNRQVTLSVAKQLEEVRWEAMEPFGRIRLDGVKLIGRDLATGVLVRSEMPSVAPLPYIEALDTKVTLCRATPPSGYEYRLIFEGRDINVSSGCVQWCEVAGHNSYSADKCQYWQPNGNEADIRAQIAEYDSYAARVHARRNLPLIVLAGLK